MTITAPPNVNYGTVIWQAVTDVTDGTDPGSDPDYVPPTGTVTFVPSVGKLLDAGATPNPITIIRDVILGVIDEAGYLCTPDPVTLAPAYRGIHLIATDEPDLNPQNAVYNVAYQLKSGRTGKTLKYPEPHQIAVPSGSTIDLTTVIPPDNAQAIGIPQANALAAAAAASAAAAEEALTDLDPTTADLVADDGSLLSAEVVAKISSLSALVVDMAGNPLGSGHVVIKVDTSHSNEINDIVWVSN